MWLDTGFGPTIAPRGPPDTPSDRERPGVRLNVPLAPNKRPARCLSTDTGLDPNAV